MAQAAHALRLSTAVREAPLEGRGIYGRLKRFLQ